jgi:hypothetical protein
MFLTRLPQQANWPDRRGNRKTESETFEKENDVHVLM